MKQATLVLFSLTILVLAGCENKNQEPAAHQEEPYTPGYTSLDTMDAAPASDTSASYESPPAETFTTTDSFSTSDDGSDEILAPVGGQVYTVQKGDTLYKLSRHFYNDQARWRDIWEANRARLANPDKLQVGMKLIIP